MPPKKTTTIKKRNQQKPLEDIQYGDVFQPINVVPRLNVGRVVKVNKNPSQPTEILSSKKGDVKVININPVLGRNRATSMQQIQVAQSGAQTQRTQTAQMGLQARPQTKQASSSVFTPLVIRKPQTAQASSSVNTPFIKRKPQTRQSAAQTQRKPSKTLDNITVSVPFLSRGQSSVVNSGVQTQRKQTAQMGMQARPQTGQMGMYAGPQTAQMGMYAGPQTAQMGMQTQSPAMVSMGTMMVQQQEQAKPQPTVMESIGNLFGYNKPQEAELVNDFVYYGYEEDPRYYKKILNEYGVTYLRSFAKQYGFKGYSTADKKELVKMLVAYFAGRQEMVFNNRNCLGMKELKNDYTLQELRKAASKLKLKAYSNLSKNDLCQVLHYYDNMHNQATEKTRNFLNKIYEKKKLL